VVNFIVDGETIRSVEINGPGSVPAFNYSGQFTGSRTITAEVIDSVLYDGRNNTRLTGLSNNDSSDEFTLSATISGDEEDVTFSWVGGSNAVTIYREDDDSAISCGGGPTGSCTVSYGSLDKNTDYYAMDNADNKSNSITFDD
jgi:hypothetical protein